jgi:hypothetical protein
LDANPSLISGLRPCQAPTGQTHRPGSGSGRDPLVVELGVASVEDAAPVLRSVRVWDASRPRCQ